VRRFARSVRPALLTAGGRTMWGRTEGLRARDLTVTGVVPVRVPRMTAHLWPTAGRTPRSERVPQLAAERTGHQ
jgi:hypothetical protein